MATSLQQMAATITERSKTLINNDLKKILKEEGAPQSGNKAALQARVIGRMSLLHDGYLLLARTVHANFTLTSHKLCPIYQ